MKRQWHRKGVLVIEGHVQGLSNTRSAGEAGIPVVVTDKSNCIARYSKYCSLFVKCPEFSSDAFIDFLIDLGVRENLEGWMLLPSNDHAVYNISKNKERIETIYKTLIPSISIISNIYNKERLLNIAGRSGIPAPYSWFPETREPINGIKFPALVKGRFGLTFYKKAGRKAFPVNSRDDLKEVIGKLKDKVGPEELFYQEQIPACEDKTISFTAFCINGEIKTHWMGTKIREHPVRFGTSTYSRSTYIPELIPLSERLIRELHYSGICEIEYLKDPRDGIYKLIEINARTWLWVGLARNCGIDYPLLAYNYLYKQPFIFPESYEHNREWMHYIIDIPYGIYGILKRHYTFREVFGSYLKFPDPAVFNMSDPIPSLAELFLLPMFLFKR